MSDLNFPDPQQDYSAESFGVPPKQKKSGSGAKTGLAFGGLTIAGCLGVVLLCCLCCVGVMVIGLRQPVGVVSFYGGAASSGSFEVANWVVCEGSQAEQITNNFESRGVSLTNFQATQDGLDSNEIDVTAQLEEDGQSRNWSATFIVSEGGDFPFNHCIETIREN